MAPKTRKNDKNQPKPARSMVIASDESDDESSNEMAQNITIMQKMLKDQRLNIKEMTKSFEFMSTGFDKLKEQLNRIELDNKKMRKDIEKLTNNEEKLNKRIHELEMNAIKAKQQANGNHLIITNMPKIEGNLKQIVIDIGIQTNTNVKDDDIIDVFQTENKKYKTNPIIVKMKTGNFKKNCIEFRKTGGTIEGSKFTNQINLTKNVNFHPLLEREIADLLKTTKAAAKAKKYKHVWVRDTTVFVRKEDNSSIIKIRSNDDIKQIK